jgi:alpha-aminoadipate carrier protein LysW
MRGGRQPGRRRQRGEIVPCGDCGAELEVVERDPPELRLAPEEEEDWGE